MQDKKTSKNEMSEKKVRHIFIYKDYFTTFYNNQSNKVKDKILWTFRIVETFKIVPTEYLKHIK